MTEKERKTEHKSFAFEIKTLDDNGGLTGYLSTFGNIDDGGDIVEAGAFTKTLLDRPVNPLLWHHDPSEPAKVIGSFAAVQDSHGLFIEADFLPDPDSQNVRMKTKALKEKGVPLGLSIGYQVIKMIWDKINGEPIRRLLELRLNEGSLTLFPMNEEALVTGIKSAISEEEEHNALPGEPGLSTQTGEPQDDLHKPEEEHLHLLDEALAHAKAISNLMEGI